jgi:acyl carrier protein
MTDQEIMQEVRSYIATTFLDGDDKGLDEKTPLLQTGIVDSMGMMDLLSWIRDRFGLDLPEEEVRPENLENLPVIVAMVKRFRKA